MAIENTTRKTAVMQGDGTSTEFSFSFRIGREEDLVVYVKKGLGAFEEQELNTDYELIDLTTDSNGNITGGKIKYPKIDENAEEQPSPLTNEDYIYAIRETPRNQLETSEQVSFKSNDIERGLDKACMQIQELTEDVSRCVKTEDWQDIDPSEIIDSIYDAVGDAGDYATAASNSANQASGYANNASTSATNSQKWAEGSDADVSPLGGTHSSKGWAQIAQAAEQSIETTIANKANKDLDNLSATGELRFTNKADTDLSNVLQNIDYVISYKAPTQADPTWYRVYRSGWCEQGGYSTGTVTFLKVMIDTNYTITSGDYRNGASTSGDYRYITAFSTTGFTKAVDSNGSFWWEVKGYIS